MNSRSGSRTNLAARAPRAVTALFATLALVACGPVDEADDALDAHDAAGDTPGDASSPPAGDTTGADSPATDSTGSDPADPSGDSTDTDTDGDPASPGDSDPAPTDTDDDLGDVDDPGDPADPDPTDPTDADPTDPGDSDSPPTDSDPAPWPEAPTPTPIAISYTLGAYYMPKPRDPGHQWAELAQLNAKNGSKPWGQRRPLLGYYQGDSPTVLDWQIKWAVERGITYFVFDDYWTESQSSPLYEGSLRAFLAARHRNTMQFAVALWQNAVTTDTGAHQRNRFINGILPYYVAHYLQRPNYLLIDGKPAIYIGARHLAFGQDATDAEIASTLAAADAYIAAHTDFTGATWVLTAHNGYTVDFTGAAAAGFDVVSPYYVLPGVYPYNDWNIAVTPQVDGVWPTGKPYSDVLAFTTAKHQESFVEAAARGLAFVPSVTSDFDTRWVWWHTGHIYFSGVTSVAYWNALGAVRGLVDTHAAATAIATRTGKPMVGLGAWNEWGESSSLEPGYAAVQANDNGDPFFYATAAAKQFGGPTSGYDTTTPGELSLGWEKRARWRFDTATGAGPEQWIDIQQSSSLRVGANDVGVLTIDGPGNVALASPTAISAADYKALKIRLAVVQGGPLADLALRWQSNDYSDTADTFGAPAEPGHRAYDELYGHNRTCTPVGAFCEYTFDLTQSPNWRGRLRAIELRLRGTSRPATIHLKEIAFVPR